MGADFDLYVRRDSWLHRLDARVKLAFVVEAVVLAFLLPSLRTCLALSALCVALAWSARVPLHRVWRVARTIAPLMAMVILLTAALGGGSGPLLVQWGPLRMTSGSLHAGLLLALRLLALALVASLWLFTTDQASLARRLSALGMPYSWGLTLALALRYLPLFAGLFEQVRDAQQARGLDLEGGSFWRKLQAYRPVLVAMLISALRNSEHLGWALEARALGAPGVRRSVYRPSRLRRADMAALAVLGIALALAISLRVL